MLTPPVEEPLLEAVTASGKSKAKKTKGAGNAANKTANNKGLSPKARTAIASDLKEVGDHVRKSIEGVSGDDTTGEPPKHDTHAKVKAAVAALETKIGNKIKAVKSKLEKEKEKEKKKSNKPSAKAGTKGKAANGNQVKKPKGKQRSRSPSKTGRSRSKSSPKA